MGTLWGYGDVVGSWGHREVETRGRYGALGVLWGRYGNITGILWGCFGVVMGPLGCYGVIMGALCGLYGALWGHYGVAMGSLWGAVGSLWGRYGALWGHYAVAVGRCGALWVAMGRCGALWVAVGRCGVIMRSLWVAMGRCGALWGCARRTLPEALSPSDRHRVYPALFGSHRPLAAAAGLFLYRRYTAPQRPTAPHAILGVSPWHPTAPHGTPRHR